MSFNNNNESQVANFTNPQNLTQSPTQSPQNSVDYLQPNLTQSPQNSVFFTSPNLTQSPQHSAEFSLPNSPHNWTASSSQNSRNSTSDSTNLNNWLTEPINNTLDLEDTDNSSLTITDDMQGNYK